MVEDISRNILLYVLLDFLHKMYFSISKSNSRHYKKKIYKFVAPFNSIIEQTLTCTYKAGVEPTPLLRMSQQSRSHIRSHIIRISTMLHSMLLNLKLEE